MVRWCASFVAEPGWQKTPEEQIGGLRAIPGPEPIGADPGRCDQMDAGIQVRPQTIVLEEDAFEDIAAAVR